MKEAFVSRFCGADGGNTCFGRHGQGGSGGFDWRRMVGRVVIEGGGGLRGGG